MNKRAKILIVDDDAPQLDAICSTLREQGYDTTCCESPHKAIQALRQDRYDILLSDLKMPGTDGIELIQHAAEIDPDVVPVLMTGQGSIPTAVQAMQVGALDYVLKPLRIRDIVPVLQRALRIRELRKENRELHASIEKRSQELEAANKELNAFAGRVAHDLREPLSIVRGFAQLLADRCGPQLGTEGATHLNYILEAASRADRMVRDLLAFARLGDSALQARPVDLNEVMQRVRQMVELGSPLQATTWEIATLPTVWGDEAMLQQAFINLVSNAQKYSRTREQPTIKVEYRRDEHLGHVISVRDNGVGFDAAQADRLFTPFQRLHRSDQFEGSGMGLANVKRIIERHGGTVGAEAREGEGAVFTVTLPSRADDGAPQR